MLSGRYLLKMLGSRLVFLNMRVIIAYLYIDGTMPLFSDLVNIPFSRWAISDATSCNSLIGIGSSDEEELIVSRSMVLSEDVGVTKRFDECEWVDVLVSDTGSDFTSSVALLEKKMSTMTCNVSIGELGYLVDLVRSSNLAHSKCVFFASRDASRRPLM